MDIPKLSMAVSSAKTSQNVGIAVMKKVMESAEQQGQDLVKMIESAGNIDIKI